MGATRKLAEFVSQLEYSDISKNAIEKAKLCLMDWIGVTIAGFISTEGKKLDRMIDSLSPFFGQPQATLLTKNRKVDIFNAALINGTAGHLLDFDDVHAGMFGHPSVPVMPAVLSVGEYLNVDGKKLITAIVAGFEAECRIGEAVNIEHYAAGWHSTATLGCFGAAAAVAKLLDLDVDKTVAALGIAGTQAFGVRQTFGTMCKPFHPGKAASNGILAGILAKDGFTAPTQILEGPNGFGKVYSTKFDESKIDNFGKPYKAEEVVYKRYASCYLTHAPIRCTLDLKKEHNVDPKNVDEIVVKVNKQAIDVAGKEDPKTGLEGKFSIKYCVALALTVGKALESQFTDELVNSPEIRKVMQKISVVPAEVGEAEAEVVMKVGGETLQKRLNLIAAEMKTPVDEWKVVLEEKFTDLVKPYAGERVVEIVNSIKNIEKISAVELTEMLR